MCTREHKQGEWQKEIEAGSPLNIGAWCGSPSQGPGIVTWSQGKSLTDWATQVPHLSFSSFCKTIVIEQRKESQKIGKDWEALQLTLKVCSWTHHFISLLPLIPFAFYSYISVILFKTSNYIECNCHTRVVK